MIYVSTHAGKHHDASEDAVLVGTKIISEVNEVLPVPDRGFICVADGVGGNRGGAQASHFVLEELAALQNIHPGELAELLAEINQKVLTAAKEDPSQADMATTLTGFYISEGAFRLLHVGNTRAYVKQGKYLKQITSDHTTYNWLKSSGQFDAAEACNKNEITNCFGGGKAAYLSKLYVSSDCQQFTLAVLTSDGVHEYVDLDSIEDILESEENCIEKCKRIIRKAVDAGSEDDMTVVVVCPAEAM